MEDGAARPRHGVPTGVLHDADRPGRVLRVSAHPDAGRVVLSTWQGASCTSTVRLDRAEVVELLAALGTALLPAPDARGAVDAEGPSSTAAAP